MRIGYPFVGDTVGGSHLSILPVIKALPTLGFEPVVIVHQAGPLQDLLESQGIAAVTPPQTRLVGGDAIPAQIATMALGAPRLAGFIRAQGISVIHTNDARMHFTWGLAARLAGAAFVWHQRSADDSRRLAQYSRLASRILTISRFCRGVFAEPMGSRAEIIYDPFEAPNPSPDRVAARQALLAELGLPQDTSIVGYVGNLTRQKRPEAFVDIAAGLSEKFSGKLVCPMFGELRQPLHQELESVIRQRGIAPICRFLGPRYPIEPLIAAMDALVAPAKFEGLGRTLVEAMTCGTPVIAADHAGHREAITHLKTGYLVDPGDTGAFCDAVIDVLNNKAQSAAIVSKARASAAAKFSQKAHLETLKSLYSGLRP